jgi:fatty-acyl-CoA synthase
MVTLAKGVPTHAGWRLTYAELAATIRATANRLHQVSGNSGPVVSILTPLLAESFIATWAGATAGVANPINPFLRVEHVAHIMNAAATTVLVCASADHGPGAWNEVEQLRTMVPTLREVWRIERGSSNDFCRALRGTAPCERLDFEHPLNPDRTVALLHTGGTTAAPKLVRLTERGMLLSAWCSGTWSGSEAAGVVAVGMPYFHVGGATCLSLAAMVFGQTMVIVSPDGYRDPCVIARFWDLVEAHGVTIAGSAPTTAAALVASDNRKPPPEGFVYWSGGATVPIQVAREFGEKFGIPLREGWGMTELHGGLIFNPNGVEPRLGSIGITFPYHRARCVSLGSRSAESEAAPQTVGVLAINGPCVTPGYLDSARNSELFFDSPSSAEKWLNTGDLSTIDADGYVWHRGRSKDLIIRGAHNIDPLLIEATLLEHPAVLYAAAVGEPDRDKGEIPVAYVQLRPGTSVVESELVDHCRREICERAAMPRTVRVIEAMPLTAVGKIFKPDLRLDAIRHCVRGLVAGFDEARMLGVEILERNGAFTVVLTAPAGAQAGAVANIRRELERYTFRVEVGTCKSAGGSGGIR